MKKGFLIIFASLIFIDCSNNPSSEATSTDTIHDTAFQKQDTVAVRNDSVTVNNNITGNSQTAKGNTTLIAGESVGNISLGTDASTLQSILGKPDMSDAAMGKAWISWYGKKRDEHNNKTELNIYTAYKDTSMREQTVQQIRTTSSFFVTADSIHVYSSLDDIKNKYAVKKAAQYKSSDGRTITLYDDKKNGIAFEIADAGSQHICTGIIIHSKNESVNNIYIMLHPDMKRFDK